MESAQEVANEKSGSLGEDSVEFYENSSQQYWDCGETAEVTNTNPGNSATEMTGEGAHEDLWPELNPWSWWDGWDAWNWSEWPAWEPLEKAKAPKRHAEVPKKANLKAQDAKKSPVTDNTTTLMLRNVPNLYDREKLMGELEELGYKGSFDFLYLPIDSATTNNVGYAFVNFEDTKTCSKCMKQISGYLFKGQPNRKRSAIVSVAHLQGLEKNLEHCMRTQVFYAPLPSQRPWVSAGAILSLELKQNSWLPGGDFAQLLMSAAVRPGREPDGMSRAFWPDTSYEMLYSHSRGPQPPGLVTHPSGTAVTELASMLRGSKDFTSALSNEDDEDFCIYGDLMEDFCWPFMFFGWPITSNIVPDELLPETDSMPNETTTEMADADVALNEAPKLQDESTPTASAVPLNEVDGPEVDRSWIYYPPRKDEETPSEPGTLYTSSTPASPSLPRFRRGVLETFQTARRDGARSTKMESLGSCRAARVEMIYQ